MHVPGHIGYGVVPWKQRRGYATQAVRDLLPYVWEEGLAYVLITADVVNQSSRRVIEANGGRLVDEFEKPDFLGGAESVRYRIDRPAASANLSIVGRL